MIDLIETKIKKQIEDLSLALPDANNGVSESNTVVFSGTYESVDEALKARKKQPSEVVTVWVSGGSFSPTTHHGGILNFDIRISVRGNYKYQKSDTQPKPRCSSLVVQIIKYLNEKLISGTTEENPSNTMLQFHGFDNNSLDGEQSFLIMANLQVFLGGKNI